jgi:hypothetical protein
LTSNGRKRKLRTAIQIVMDYDADSRFEFHSTGKLALPGRWSGSTI